jgi:hypothetical protein
VHYSGPETNSGISLIYPNRGLDPGYVFLDSDFRVHGITAWSQKRTERKHHKNWPAQTSAFTISRGVTGSHPGRSTTVAGNGVEGPLDRRVCGVLKAYPKRPFRRHVDRNPGMRRSKSDAVQDLIAAWEGLRDTTIEEAWDIYSPPPR